MISDRSIASARQLSFAIFIVGALALQMGWLEYQRQDSVVDFAYAEKLLLTLEKLRDGEFPTNSFGTGLGADASNLVPKPYSALYPEFATELRRIEWNYGVTITRADPFDNCRALVGSHSLEGESGIWNLYLIDFIDSPCDALLGDRNPVVVSFHPHDDSYPWVVRNYFHLRRDIVGADSGSESDVILDLLDSVRIGNPGPIASLHPAPLSSTVMFIEATVRGRANRVTGMRYAGDETDMAIRDALETRRERPTLFGLQLDVGISLLSFPLAMLALSFLFWHRINRVEASSSEPWILLNIQNPMERAGALAWILVLLAAPLAVISVVFVFRVAPTFLTLSIAACVTSELFLGLAMVRLNRINQEAQQTLVERAETPMD